ncbi:MAG: ABC transporter ATP-binding protein, partial [Acetobacteraceae bacterium]|nr:ABC transporter ATP-binding protein [Acetobacteraceae bacterium]
WFLAGDADFMEKARTRLEDMVRGAEILVLSSHQEGVIATWCSRVLWLEGGRIRDDGPADEVMQRYLGRPVQTWPEPVSAPQPTPEPADPG